MAASVIATSANSTSVSVPISGSILQGDTLILCVSGYSENPEGYISDDVADATDGSYLLVARSNWAPITSEIWVKQNCSPTTNRTITIDPPGGSANFWSNFALLARGLETSNIVRDQGDDTNNATATDASVASDGSATQAGDLIIVHACVKISGSSNVGFDPAPSSGYTAIGLDQNYNANNSHSSGYKIAGAGGSQSANWSHSSTLTAGNGWVTTMGVFKALGGGSVPGGALIQHFRNLGVY